MNQAMYPILSKFGAFELRSYDLALAIGTALYIGMIL
jgi:hypothetical protein